MQPPEPDITGLLTDWQRGDNAALDRLLPMIRCELDRIARGHLGREGKGNVVQPSSLVQEAFLRLLPGKDAEWKNREHFFAVASRVMRHVLVDYARQRRRDKRGAAAVHIPIETTDILSPNQIDDVIEIDLALERLAAVDKRKSQVLELRLFGGLSVDETAEALGVAPNTVIRDWNFARAWLRRELTTTVVDDGPPAKN